MNEGLPLADAAVGRLADVWVYLSASPLLGLTVTLLVYHGAFVTYRRSGFHPLANPVALSVIVLGALLWATGTAYATYFEGAQFVHFLLGTATVSLAVPIYKGLPSLRGRMLPVLAALHINPIWYGILLTINLELALITPPVGMNLFAIKAITRAPIAAASCTMFRPTPPQPNTSTQSPGTTLPRRTTAWNGVVMASAMMEPASRGISGGRR